ncbi:MAG TPA: tRNA (adenosine(37)-N6)-threonylcarbamoyltransferase complex ATPase subunit type 1 TsaE [Acholeplasmatales bacterium]|nr:tRNA (adenosine(37)-N6)-threonylcarbamoyltransferase complex ATPase subunit type 1 TsaE [Acholeplasmatales bacterium]
MMEKNIFVADLAAMKRFAFAVARHAKPGFVIGLAGDLGSGKTTFTKYLAEAMGIQDVVNSPTFTILKIYRGTIPLYHMDVYRLETIGYDWSLEEYIDGDGVAVIEWYPYVGAMLPKNLLSIDIRATGETAREIRIKGEGEYDKVVEDVVRRYGN